MISSNTNTHSSDENEYSDEVAFNRSSWNGFSDPIICPTPQKEPAKKDPMKKTFNKEIEELDKAIQQDKERIKKQ